MKDYSAMSDFDINKAVAKALLLDWSVEPSHRVVCVHSGNGNVYVRFNPCSNPADAWPIIDENNISIISDHPELRIATSSVNFLMNEIDSEYYFQSAHENGLRAAMIVYLQMMEAKV